MTSKPLAGLLSIPHTGGARGSITEVRNALKLSWRYIEPFEAEAAALQAAPINTEQMRGFAHALLEVDSAGTSATVRHRHERVSGIVKLWASSPTIAPIAGMRWADYRAVTEYFDHVVAVRGARSAGGADTARALGKGCCVGRAAFFFLRMGAITLCATARHAFATCCDARVRWAAGPAGNTCIHGPPGEACRRPATRSSRTALNCRTQACGAARSIVRRTLVGAGQPAARRARSWCRRAGYHSVGSVEPNSAACTACASHPWRTASRNATARARRALTP